MSKVSVKRHLKELQWRLIIVAIFFIAGAALAYNYQAFLVPALLEPLHGEKLVYLNPAGGFSFIFLISIYVGIALAFPVLIQQLYAFLRPALPERARKKSWVIIVSSFLLLICGIAFGYLIAVPNALAFLYGFADQFVTASLTADSYLNFLIAYTVGIGIVFQLPLLLLLIHSIKPLTPGGLFKSQKWVILGSFIVAAIITPTPDPINQAIIAGPVIVIYQIGVVAVLLNIAKVHRANKRAAKTTRKRASLSDEQYFGLIASANQEDDEELLKAFRPAVLATQLPEDTAPTQTTQVLEQVADIHNEVETAAQQEAAFEAELEAMATVTPVPTENLQKVTFQPITPPIQQTTVQHQAQTQEHTQAQPQPIRRQVRSMDGFMRVQPGQRQAPVQRATAVPRPAPRPQPAPMVKPTGGFADPSFIMVPRRTATA